MSIRRTLLSVVLIGACIWCTGLVRKVYSEEKAAADKEDCFKPVAPVHDLMEGQEEHFKAIDKQLKEKDKANFKVIRISANVLAELCNVNQYQKKEEDYRKWSVEARDLSLQLAKAAKEKDAAKAGELFREIHTRCTSCHDKYNN